ncbi:MAG: membrane protein insertase YidC [Treponema sp.]|jgi:YidC/Oxa1 family membrane protein insertase|nr:membrane protein insertase YidC [Treponema sp.]
MDKKTLLFVAISAAILFSYYAIQYKFFPPAAPAEQAQQTQQANDAVSPALTPSAVVSPAAVTAAVDAGVPAEVTETGNLENDETVVIETELLSVVLSNRGGDIVSYRLKQHKDKDEAVQMVLSPPGKESHAFTIAFGGMDALPVSSHFKVSRPAGNPLSVEFSGDFNAPGGMFTLKKRYDFTGNEYMFALTVSVESAGNIPLGFNNIAYTLAYGPQMGPGFQKLDRYETRQYIDMVDGKRKTEKVSEGSPQVIGSGFAWAGIAGKYFAALAVPADRATPYTMGFSAEPEAGLPAASRFYLMRPALAVARASDSYYFYLGPKTQDDLGRYDTGNNAYKLRDLQFIKAASTSGILSPLEWILKLMLRFFYNLLPRPNYGVAIILLTLLVKIILFPLTKKSSEMSIKMQAIAPKIKELQEKYKDNAAKLNTEMAALYKREGHNPMSGCLPLLIQMPILFAMYNLFNNHFDLRGAMFISGWIPDLSLPESVYHFANTVPLLNWDSLRLLPFIYLGSQLLYGFATSTPDQQGNPSMKMMVYAMPIMFFFLLYNVPSGLLVFWIMSNLFTLVQQLALNKYLKKKRAELKSREAEQQPVIAPRRKKRR